MCTITAAGVAKINFKGKTDWECPWFLAFDCGTPPENVGEWKVIFYNGEVRVCGPRDDCPSTDSTGGDFTKVFCDPCLNRCDTDGNSLKYSGSEKWLFTTYVNNSPEPVAKLLTTYNVRVSPGKNSIEVCVNGTCMCCPFGCMGKEEQLKVPYVEKTVSIEEVIKSTKQPVIGFDGNPEDACKCGGDGGPFVPNACGNLRQAFDTLRGMEYYKCSPA